MLDPEIKDTWITALESGDYPKTIANLRSDRGFCCLGVLADITGATWEHSYGSVEKCYCPSLPDGRMVGGYLPADYCGLSEDDQRNLARINDETNTFEEVISYIKTIL